MLGPAGLPFQYYYHDYHVMRLFKQFTVGPVTVVRRDPAAIMDPGKAAD
jgi:hypothetical protein